MTRPASLPHRTATAVRRRLRNFVLLLVSFAGVLLIVPALADKSAAPGPAARSRCQTPGWRLARRRT